MGKLRTFFAIALPMSLFLGRPAVAQELWNGFLFGDSKDHVMKEFPNSKIEHEKIKESNSEIDYIIVNGFGDKPCNLLVDFSFPYPFKSLTAVHTKTEPSIMNAPQATREQCARQILQVLITKYGMPNQLGYAKNKEYRAGIWNRGEGVFIEFIYIDAIGVSITYSKGTPDTIIPFKDMKSAL